MFLSSWDIIDTINIDQEIENERDEAMINATLMLIRNLQANGDVPANVLEKSTAKFRKRLSDLDQKLDADYKKEVEAIYNGLSAKNKVQFWLYKYIVPFI